GYGATSDGEDMVQPSGAGAVRCMRQALAGTNDPIGHVNAHGTSTPIGDEREIAALKEVFGDKTPPISSTKSLTGHSQGATGVHEAIYSLLMMQHGFIAASANVDNLDPECVGADIVRETRDNVRLNCVLTNIFGFGGTNATLVFRRYEGREGGARNHASPLGSLFRAAQGVEMTGAGGLMTGKRGLIIGVANDH